MPNPNAPYGFRSIGRTINGGEIELNPFNKLASYGTGIFVGDVVAQNAAGDVDRVITPGTTLISGVSLNHSPASTLGVILACTQPGALYSAQADGSFVYADIGLNCNCKLGTGSAVTRQSADVLDTTTEAVTGTLDLHLLRRLALPGNDYGLYCRFEVVFNEHRMNPVTVGV